MLPARAGVAIVEAVRLGAADYVVKPDDRRPRRDRARRRFKSAIEKTRLVSEITELRRG